MFSTLLLTGSFYHQFPCRFNCSFNFTKSSPLNCLYFSTVRSDIVKEEECELDQENMSVWAVNSAWVKLTTQKWQIFTFQFSDCQSVRNTVLLIIGITTQPIYFVRCLMVKSPPFTRIHLVHFYCLVVFNTVKEGLKQWLSTLCAFETKPADQP